jgi:proliferating cell nuclear antigen
MAYASVVLLPSDKFQRIVRDLQCLGDICTISAKGDSIKFLVPGDLGCGGVLLKTVSGVGNHAGPVTVSVSEDVKLSFALRYLHVFSKAAPLVGDVTLSMNYEKPMMITYQIGTHGKLSFYLAPKFDDPCDNNNPSDVAAGRPQ